MQPNQPQNQNIQTPINNTTESVTNVDTKVRNAGVVIAIVSAIMLSASNVMSVDEAAFIVSIVGTTLIAKGRKINLAWGIGGILPVIGPLFVFFVKSVKSVYGTPAVPGQPKKKNIALIVILILAALMFIPFIAISLLSKH